MTEEYRGAVKQPPLFPQEKQIELPARLGRTAVTYRPAREILTRATGFIGGYDFTLNPYSGCGFGCTYCYAAFFTRRQEQQDNWGLWVNAKENAARLMGELRPGELDGKRIYMSSVTDPYQPVERKLELTRRILEVLAGRHRPKLVVQTRSPLALRDADLFREIERNGGRVQINMTVTTDDEDVRMTFEPGCPSNPARLKAIGRDPGDGGPVLHHPDAPAAGPGRGDLRRKPAGDRRPALHSPDLPLPEGRVHRPDPSGGPGHHGGETGLHHPGLPTPVRGTLPAGVPCTREQAAGAGRGPSGLRAAVLRDSRQGHAPWGHAPLESGGRDEQCRWTG